MSKMSKVAKMFGKKIGEEFEILDTKKNIILQQRFIFTELALENLSGVCDSASLTRLINGNYKICDRNYKPAAKQQYFMPDITSINLICKSANFNRNIDKVRLDRKNLIFKTSHDAHNLAVKILDFIKKEIEL